MKSKNRSKTSSKVYISFRRLSREHEQSTERLIPSVVTLRAVRISTKLSNGLQ